MFYNPEYDNIAVEIGFSNNMPEQDPQDTTEADPRLNSNWIMDRAGTLLHFASVKYSIYGRGAIVINPTDILVPPKYLTLPEIEEQGLTNLKGFAEKYNPEGGFVIALIQPDEKQMIFRVDIEPLDPPPPTTS